MARKRYQVEFSEEFYRVAKTGAVARNLTVGQWIEAASKLNELADAYKEAPMDEPVKKAIEKDQVKREPRGRVSKGLGDIPGVTDRDPFQEFRPAPKPGKSK